MKNAKYHCPKCGGNDTMMLFVNWICNTCNPAKYISTARQKLRNPHYAWFECRVTAEHVKCGDWFVAYTKKDEAPGVFKNLIKVQTKGPIKNGIGFICIVDNLDCTMLPTTGTCPAIIVEDESN